MGFATGWKADRKLECGIPRAAELQAEIKLCVIGSDELSKLGRIVPMYWGQCQDVQGWANGGSALAQKA